MIVTFFHGSRWLASLPKIAGPVFPPGTAISDASRASTALSMMNPTSPATASASSSRESYSHHSASIMGAPRESPRRWLRVSEPSCNRLSRPIHRGPEAKPVVGEVADRRIDGGDAGAPVDDALADEPARVDPEAQEHRGPARPLVEQAAREIAAAKHRRHQARRRDGTAVPAAARAIAPTAAAGAAAQSAGAGPRPANIGRALRRRGALARGLTRGDRLHRRRFDPRLGGRDGRRFAADVLRRRSALLLLRLLLLA